MTTADENSIQKGIPRDFSEVADDISRINEEFGNEEFAFDVAYIRDPWPFFLMYELIKIADERGKEGALAELEVLWQKHLVVQLIESDYMFMSREMYDRMLSEHFGR